MNKKKEYLASAPFYQQCLKNICLKAVAVPCFMAGARLMKVKTWSIYSLQIDRKAS
jgi:hypothetical protein